jgi:hypothetical protein
MKTDELISLMAASDRPVDTGWLGRTTWLAALLATVATVGLVLLTLGARHDLAATWASGPVLTKALFGASVATIALAAFQKSLRPGLKPRKGFALVAVPVLAVAIWAAVTLMNAAPEQWTAMTFGRSWRACLIAIPLYALVPFALLLALARQGAPVDQRFSGASAGLASAGLATIAYSVHCPEDTIPFIASWYPLAMAAMAGFGAWIFPRLVRW